MKILLAIDGSLYSDAAVAEVGRWPWLLGSEVLVITTYAIWTKGLAPGNSSSMFAKLNNQFLAAATKAKQDDQPIPLHPMVAKASREWLKDRGSEPWRADIPLQVPQ